MIKKLTDNQISTILNDADKMTRILQIAVNEALLVHKRAGNPVCGYQNGKLVWVTAEEILIHPIEDN